MALVQVGNYTVDIDVNGVDVDTFTQEADAQYNVDVTANETDVRVDLNNNGGVNFIHTDDGETVTQKAGEYTLQRISSVSLSLHYRVEQTDDYFESTVKVFDDGIEQDSDTVLGNNGSGTTTAEGTLYWSQSGVGTHTVDVEVSNNTGDYQDSANFYIGGISLDTGVESVSSGVTANSVTQSNL